ncbi:MAG: hypothetical protein ABSC22_07595 [Roseiarcus sp.]
MNLQLELIRQANQFIARQSRAGRGNIANDHVKARVSLIENAMPFSQTSRSWGGSVIVRHDRYLFGPLLEFRTKRSLPETAPWTAPRTRRLDCGARLKSKAKTRNVAPKPALAWRRRQYQ